MSALRRFFHEDNSTEQRGQSGQSLVEFALLMPIMLLIITGLFDVARAVWEENTLAYAAREGTRFAIVHGSAGQGPLPDGWAWGAADPTDVNDHVIGYVKTVVKQAAIGVPSVTVTVTYPDTYPGTGPPPVKCADRNCRVIVDASAPFVPLPSQYLLGGAFQITLKGGSQLVIQR
ncbi:MAG: pilus assembly protein [Chloroflexi bacterium]|nr:MAG: pilus assembly protein [Chloroflexota bacterium]